MHYKEAKIHIDKDYSEDLNQFLDSLQMPGHYEILFDSDEPNDSGSILKTHTNIKAYLNPQDWEKEIQIRVFLQSICPDSHSLEIRDIETREYEEAYKEYYKPFSLGKIWIVPIWEKDNPIIQEKIQSDQIPLYLNPGVAFGTGHHETTQLLLEILPDFFPEKKHILDLGTGSGILSLACGLLGAESIYSVDIDPNAVGAALSNWKENSYPNNCKFEAEVGGLDHKRIFEKSYDLVLANITFAVLSQNIEHIAKISSSEFLFSGIITERKKDFLDILEKTIPGSAWDIKDRNGWERIHWKRK